MYLPILGIVAAAAPPSGTPQSSMLVNLVPLVLIFAIFYFLMILPQRKKQKQHTEMVDNLKPGDRIVTNGGIYGTVVGVTDQIIQLRIADQVKIEIAKHAIAGLQERAK
jgi:preprotein translocase subunit YajC